MPVFLQGRRAFLSSLRRRHRRCNPLSVHRVSDSGLAYPRRAYSCFTYSCRACPAAAAACHSYSHLASPAAAAPLPPPSDTEAPHGPQPFPLGLKCRHGPCSFSCSTERRTADPRPCSARSTKKRTEPHKAPSAAKSNQSVTAAAPRQVNRPSGKSFSQRVCTPTPGNTRPSPAPKRSASRYRATPRKVLRKANEAGATRNRTDR